jgi:hypothetical protein
VASVRDAKALSKLPPKKQNTWQQLWTDITALRQRAVTGMP